MISAGPSTMTREDIDGACRGDSDALTSLVTELLPVVKVEVVVALHNRAGAVGRDARQDVEDFVQDVMLHLLDNGGRVLQGWDPARGRSLRSFVRLVTRHRVARVLQGFRGNPWGAEAMEREHLERLAADTGVFRRLASRDKLAWVLDKLWARLDERGQGLFQMLYVEQRPMSEVCESMQMSAAAVRQWTARLRRRLRALEEAA